MSGLVLCECAGGLGGDGIATEKWMGSKVCKVCKKMDQIRNSDPIVDKKKKIKRKTETMEKCVYKHYNKWVVKRKINKRIIYFGAFETKKEAIECRNKIL